MIAFRLTLNVPLHLGAHFWRGEKVSTTSHVLVRVRHISISHHACDQCWVQVKNHLSIVLVDVVFARRKRVRIVT